MDPVVHHHSKGSFNMWSLRFAWVHTVKRTLGLVMLRDMFTVSKCGSGLFGTNTVVKRHPSSKLQLLH